MIFLYGTTYFFYKKKNHDRKVGQDSKGTSLIVNDGITFLGLN
jgi:hypothetical protein